MSKFTLCFLPGSCCGVPDCVLYPFLCRDEIADCSGQAYDHLPVNDAMEMLMFPSDQQLLEYISEVNVLLSLVFYPISPFFDMRNYLRVANTSC